MSLETLFSKTEKELGAMKKADIVTMINDARMYHYSKKQLIDGLQAEVKSLKAPYDQAKLIVCGAAGIEVPKCEYSGSVQVDKIDLCHAIGLLLNKHYELLSGQKDSK